MYDKWLFILAMLVLIAGGVLSFFINARFSVVALLGLIAALYVGFRRDTYLPFLGESVMPCSLLQEQTPDHADTDVNVSGLEPGAKVLFWAAEPATAGLATIKDWQRAYLEFANAGVARVGADGHAVFRIRKPQPYTVPLKGRLNSHVHWRVCSDGGMIGPVQTTEVTH